jgi:hypothetical protein
MICINVTLPTYSDVLGLILNSHVDIQKLLGISVPLLGGLSCSNIETPLAALLLIPKHLISIVSVLLSPCLSVLGGEIDDNMPLLNGIVKFTDVLQFDIFSFNGQNQNIVGGVSNSAIDSITSLILYLPLYVLECIEHLKLLIDKAVFVLSGFTTILPKLPDFPVTISDVKKLFGSILGIELQSLSSLSISDLENLEFLGIPLLTVSYNTLGNLSAISLDTANKLLSTIISLPTIVMSKLMDIIDAVKDLLNVNIPTFCLST